MEKIIDRILSDLRFTPILFNNFCSENNIDKSSLSAFKSSLETAKENLSKEKENIKNNLPPFRTERDLIRIKMDIWGERVPVYGDKKIYPRGTDLKQVEKDNKRINLIENRYLPWIESMLQIVNLYPDKETTPTKENESNVPRLMQFEEPLKSKIDEINSYLLTAKMGNVKEREMKNRVKIKVRKVWKDNSETIYFTKTFSNRENFFRMIHPSLKFPFVWDIESYVKTLSNN